jgi:hypothetical protein
MVVPSAKTSPQVVTNGGWLAYAPSLTRKLISRIGYSCSPPKHKKLRPLSSIVGSTTGPRGYVWYSRGTIRQTRRSHFEMECFAPETSAIKDPDGYFYILDRLTGLVFRAGVDGSLHVF